MDQISQIKQKLDIVDVVGAYVPIKKSGRNYKGLCPFHSEKTPSFMVSQELQIYKCFGCGSTGDIFAFVKQIEGVEFPQALEILADKAGIKLEKSDYDPQNQIKKQIYFINDVTSKFYHYILLKHPSGKNALTYLTKERGLNLDTINEFNIGYAPDTWDTLYRFLTKKGFKVSDLIQAGVIVERQENKGYIDKFRGRITFPLTAVDGKVLGFTARTTFNREPKYLNTSETPVFHKTDFLFGLDKNKLGIKKEGAVFVEGQMDLISAFQAGIKNVVSVSGTSLTDHQLSLLARYTNNITFCFDADGAGISASYRAIEMAERLNFNVTVAMIPQPYKDLDDICRASKETAKKLLSNSIPVYDYFLVTTLKKYDKNTALGKKSIMEDLLPLFSRITNQVLFGHYSKEIAQELGLSEDSVSNMLKKGTLSQNDREDLEFEVVNTRYKQDPEGYFIALLFKTDLDEAKEFMYKVKPQDYHNENLWLLLEKVRKLYDSREKRVKITSFISKLDENLQVMASDLYLWDVESIVDFSKKEVVEREFESTIKRIKLNATKKSLIELSDQIKLAEKEKNTEELEKLTKKFEKLSKGLL